MRDPGTHLLIARLAFLVLLTSSALLSPGFFLQANISSLLTSVSFIGCVSVGMTLITISGNLLSFSLSVTTAAAAMVFVAGVNWGGGIFGAMIALIFGAVVTGLQGFVIGFFRSHPIIVSIAALALMTGLSDPLTHSESFSIETSSGYHVFQSGVLGIPIEFIIFIGVVATGQLILTYTSFGRCLYMIGNSMRAAESAGINIWKTITAGYALSGLFTALAGILLGAHYQMADMQYGAGYDYQAIAAVLVGGTSIRGGQGSIIRTLAGVMVIAIVQSVLLLQGLHTEWQYLISGIIVLAVIILNMNVNKG